MSSEQVPHRASTTSSPLPPGLAALSPARRRVVAEIVRLLIPSYPLLDAGDREGVHEAVTRFVVSQIEALPTFIGIPYRTTITAFQLLATARFGRRFLALNDAGKEAYLGIWADAPIGPARDFVKLIRSCALLAYFDHPKVLPHLGKDTSQAVLAGGSSDAS